MTSTATRPRPRETDPLKRYGVSVEDPPDMTVEVERVGPSYVASIRPLGARLVFREIRLDRDPSAEIAISSRSRHLFRTTTTLSLTGRDRLAKFAHELSGRAGDIETWKRAVFTAVEKVIEAEERIDTVDLRAPMDTRRAIFVAGHFLVEGPTLLVAPGESGKSTLARAIAVGFASHREVVPGIAPRRKGPVLYVAAEAPLVASHRRSIESICRGLDMGVDDIEFPIELYPTRGKPLHKIARSLAERAADFTLVILDSLQALLSVSEHTAGVRERDTMFWNAIDQIDRPTLIIAHPNREDAQRWAKSDGRAAGSDVTRDRARISWAAKYADEQAVTGQSRRRYTLRCTKFNDGPRPPAFGVAVDWVHGTADEDPGTVYFTEVEPQLGRPQATPQADVETDKEVVTEQDLTPVMRATLEAFRAGCTTPSELMRKFPGLSRPAADKRLVRIREYLAQAGQTGAFETGS